jgi:hypothetical protein
MMTVAQLLFLSNKGGDNNIGYCTIYILRVIVIQLIIN